MPRFVPILLFVTLQTLLATFSMAQTTASASRNSGQGALPTLEEVLAELKSREKAAKSVLLEMTSTGWFPGGRTVKTAGTLRVLGKTHVHIKMTADFGDDMRGQNETVKTPDGVWTREQDPAQGTVCTHMSLELMKQLDDALTLLGDGRELPGVPNGIDEANGSAMIESLQKSFTLKVERRLVLEGQEFIVLKGPARAGAPPSEERDLPEPDSVEVLVRPREWTIAAMRQFKDGKPILEITISRLELDRDMDPASFRIELAEGQKFVAAMAHPPMQAQIEKILKDAEQKRGQKK